MNFDLNIVPFSRRESFLAISLLPAAKDRRPGLYLRTVRGGDDKFGEAFLIELLNRQSEPVPFEPMASPDKIRLKASDSEGHADICLSDSRTVRFRSEGCGIRLTFFQQRMITPMRPIRTAGR